MTCGRGPTSKVSRSGTRRPAPRRTSRPRPPACTSSRGTGPALLEGPTRRDGLRGTEPRLVLVRADERHHFAGPANPAVAGLARGHVRPSRARGREQRGVGRRRTVRSRPQNRYAARPRGEGLAGPRGPPGHGGHVGRLGNGNARRQELNRLLHKRVGRAHLEHADRRPLFSQKDLTQLVRASHPQGPRRHDFAAPNLTLAGQLKNERGAAVRGVKVYLEMRMARSSTWRTLGMCTSDSRGRVSRRIPSQAGSLAQVVWRVSGTTYWRWRVPTQKYYRHGAVSPTTKIVIRR